ncbi:MAG: hypothetical protein ABH879_04930, partial [archaeon]
MRKLVTAMLAVLSLILLALSVNAASDKSSAMKPTSPTALDIAAFTETTGTTSLGEGGNVTNANLTTTASTIK